MDKIVQLYIDSAKENLRLYDGFEFTGAFRQSAGHPFFEFDGPRKSTIVYDGTVYPGVSLAYDLTKDEVIFVNPVTNLNISLITSNVEKFKIGDHSFVLLTGGSEKDDFPGNGFYQLLLDGEIPVFAKRKKKLRDPADARELARFIQTDNYFVKKDSVYYRVDSKRSLLGVCRDRKAEVQKFIRESGLNFEKEFEQAIIKVMDFYSHLKK